MITGIANTDFKIPKNNTFNFDVSIYGIVDCSGYIPYFTAKHQIYDASALISKTGFIKDPSGTARFVIPSLDTSINPIGFCWDIVIEKDGSVFSIDSGQGSIIVGVRY